MIRNILKVLGVVLIFIGLSSAESLNLLVPIACLVVGGIIMFILYETEDTDDYL